MVTRSFASSKLMESQLSTFELLSLLGQEPHFIGVFPIDLLSNTNKLERVMDKHTTIKLVVNLQPHHLPGSHWVAIYRRNGIGFYFDSFGRPPPSLIKAWLSKNTLRWKYHQRMIQHPNDKTSCGYICYAFLKKLS